MLELHSVSKTFNIGTINEKKAICGINLRLNEGDRHRYRRQRGQIHHAQRHRRRLVSTRGQSPLTAIR